MQGQVGLRPPTGFACDMREGWRELRVYLSAHSSEMQEVMQGIVHVLQQDLAPFTNSRYAQYDILLLRHACGDQLDTARPVVLTDPFPRPYPRSHSVC